jgi:hypothetical protein
MKSKGLFVILLLLTSFLPAQAATITAAGAPVSDAQTVLTIVNQLDFPADWKIYVAGEKQWAGLMDQVDHTSQLAVTDRQKHITVLRAAGVNDPNLTGHYITTKHVLAHELGHIVCNCDDEWKAENYAHKHE